MTSKDEQRRLKKKERADRRRTDLESKARLKMIRRAVILLVVAVIVVGVGYLVLSSSSSGLGIGPLNSAHEHADWMLYVNGKAVDIDGAQYKVKSDYVHMEGTTHAIHMHATNVPLGYFIGTLGMKITPTSIAIEGATYTNEGDKKLRMFVNGKENFDYDRYVLKSLDKILIAYGKDTDEQIQKYLQTIPDEARKLDAPQQP